MKLLIVLTIVIVAAVRLGDAYVSKYDNFNVDEVIDNERLLKTYAHCFIGDGKCTPEGKEVKGWIPDAIKNLCGECTEKQKVMTSKTIKALQKRLPEEWEAINKLNDPDGKYADELKKFLASF